MNMSLLRRLCVIGLLSGLLCVLASMTPAGKSLEENLGLAFLFNLRGTRTVPDEPLIYAIEQKSAEFFGLKQQPYKWPRTIHAQAVDKLTALKAGAIGYDLFFEESRSIDDDEEFSRAIRDSGRVVLLQRLKKIIELPDDHLGDGPSIQPKFSSEQLIPVVQILEHEAAALAPFPLPQLPARLNQAWLFKEGAGEKATLPVTMLAVFKPELLERFLELVRMVEPSVTNRYQPPVTLPAGGHRVDSVLQQLKTLFQAEITLKNKVLNRLDREKEGRLYSQSEQKMLESMVQILGGDRSIFINYYGPPGTIHTRPYYKLLEEATAEKSTQDLHNRAIFIGLNHEAELGEKDGFYTTFTNSKGKNISGVEVAATVFANLLDGSVIKPINSLYAITLIFSMGMGIGTISRTVNPTMAGMMCFCLCLVYLTIVYLIFVTRYLWTPFVVPILVQVPLTYLTVTLLKHRKILRDKKNIKKALQCYIPERIAAELELDFSQIVNKRDEVHGICLYSDLENYTVISEKRDHGELSKLINDYYEEMFQVVKQYSGMVLDIRGDSMLALWLNNDFKNEPVSQSCHAAFSISRIFNNANSIQNHHLPTRIGLHQGRISLGNIGALDHFQYTITGDTVNTVARIESLNKQLGTRLLVSEIIAQKAVDSEFRKIGTFLFVGKNKPLTIYELLGRKNDISQNEEKLSFYFAKALEMFQQGQWSKSKEIFEHCSRVCAGYGPALWFQQLCSYHMIHVNAKNWDGVIRLEQK